MTPVELAKLQQREILRIRRAGSLAAIRNTQRAMALLRQDLAHMSLGVWSLGARQRVMASAVTAMSQLVTAHVGTLRGTIDKALEGGARATGRALRELDKRPPWATLDSVAARVRSRRTLLRTHESSMLRYGSEVIGQIERQIAQGIATGKSWPEARDAVWKSTRKVVGGNQWMVDRILRTETSNAYNGAVLDALEAEDAAILSKGLPLHLRPMKRLIHVYDKRTGKDSLAEGDQVRAIGDPFYSPLRGLFFQHPPDRPNDRGTLIPWRPVYELSG